MLRAETAELPGCGRFLKTATSWAVDSASACHENAGTRTSFHARVYGIAAQCKRFSLPGWNPHRHRKGRAIANCGCVRRKLERNRSGSCLALLTSWTKVDVVVLSRTKWSEGPCGFPANHKILRPPRRTKSE